MEEISLVSIVIPTYKRPNRLDRAIDSCLAQTYKDIEIIVVDDNSDGDEFRLQTEELMLKYEDNPAVRYFKHSVN